jgi:hypothetical protein
MDIIKEFERLEDLYYGDWDEDKDALVKELRPMHEAVKQGDEDFNRFLVQVADRFGGTYIPYLFWEKLATFAESSEDRSYLQQLIKAFVNSDFDESEQKLLKPLMVVYLAKEKDFEIDKVRALIIDKAHPEVRDYFHKLISFVKKNERSTEMYCEKFELLKHAPANFELLAMPITQLREHLESA